MKPNRLPGTLDRLRAAVPLLPGNYPLPEGHALRAFLRAAPGLDPMALSDALGDAVPLPAPVNRRRLPTRPQRRHNASEQARYILSRLRCATCPHPSATPQLSPCACCRRDSCPAFPRDLADVASEFDEFAGRNGLEPAASPFRKALEHLRSALRDYSPSPRYPDTQLEKLHADSLTADLITHAAEARNQPVTDPFSRMLLEHAAPLLRADARQPAPPLPETPANTMFAVTWTAPVRTGRDDDEQRSRRLADAIQLHCDELAEHGAHLVIPVLHGFARMQDDSDPVFSHPSLDIAKHLQRHGIPFASLDAGIDAQGQACVPGLSDPAFDPRPTVLLVTAPGPFPDEDISTMRSEAEAHIPVIRMQPAWSVVSDDLVTAAAIAVSGSATILRSDADMGKDFTAHSNAATGRLARPQIDEPIRKAIACVGAAYGPEFPLRIETAATVCDCLDRDGSDMPRAIDAIARGTPETPAAAGLPRERPPFRLALHLAFPRTTEPGTDGAGELREHTVRELTDALTRTAVHFRKTFFALQQQDPALAARIPAKVSLRYMAGSDDSIAADLRQAIHSARTPKPGQTAIGEFEPLADAALPDPDTHLVLAEPRDLPLPCRNALGAACHAAANGERRKPAILLREPCSELILYGNPAARPPGASAMPRTPGWSGATAHTANAPLIGSTRSHGALQPRQDRSLTDPEALSTALVLAAFAAAGLPESAYRAAGVEPCATVPSATPTALREDMGQAARPRFHPTDPSHQPYWPEARTAMEQALQSSSMGRFAA